MITTRVNPERALLVGVILPRYHPQEVYGQMEELARLTTTAGAHVVGEMIQARHRLDPALFLGKGKVAEIKDRLRVSSEEMKFDLIISNEDLSPRQQRNLEEEIGVKVIDRTELILDIFGQHAHTREGKIQVETAQLAHQLSRLVGSRTYARQQGGIGGRGGAGEQQIELDKRKIRFKLKKLEKELKGVEQERHLQNLSRQKSNIPLVVIVGYTNAGKSTLMNLLTSSKVTVEDKLFATLDPTTRKFTLPTGQKALLVDTVGFIQKLPTELIASFRATLEIVSQADCILEVVDVSAPSINVMMSTVDAILKDLGADSIPRVIALNKQDRLSPQQVLGLRLQFQQAYHNVVAISAQQNTDVSRLTECLESVVQARLIQSELLLPYKESEIIAHLHSTGASQTDPEYLPEGIKVKARLTLRQRQELKDFLISEI